MLETRPRARRSGCFLKLLAEAIEIAPFLIERGFARLQTCGALAQRLDGLVELFERVGGGACIGAHAMGFEERPRPERLDKLKNARWQYLERGARVLAELGSECEAPALQRGCNGVGARAAHAGAHE